MVERGKEGRSEVADGAAARCAYHLQRALAAATRSFSVATDRTCAACFPTAWQRNIRVVLLRQSFPGYSPHCCLAWTLKILLEERKPWCSPGLSDSRITSILCLAMPSFPFLLSSLSLSSQVEVLIGLLGLLRSVLRSSLVRVDILQRRDGFELRLLFQLLACRFPTRFACLFVLWVFVCFWVCVSLFLCAGWRMDWIASDSDSLSQRSPSLLFVVLANLFLV